MMLRSLAAAIILILAAANPAVAQTYTWTATSSGNWNNSGNWDSNGIPVSGTSAQLVFGGSTSYTATNDIGSGTFTLNTLTVSNTGATTIAPNAAANTLTFGGTNPALTINSGAGATTISTGVIFSANTSVTNNSSNTLAITAPITFNSNTTTTFSGSGNIGLSASSAAAPSLTFQNGSSIVYTGSGVFSVGPQGVNGGQNNMVFANNGTYSFTNGVQGAGSSGTFSMGDNASGAANTTTLYNAATGVTMNFSNFSSGVMSVGNMGALNGTININAGTVRFGVSSGPAINTGGDLFGSSTTLNVASGATFDFNGNAESMGAISGSGTIKQGTIGLTMGITGNQTWGGVLTGSGGFSTGAAGVNYTFTGNNTSTGTTTIVAGSSLTLGNGGTTGIVAGNIANSGTLTFNRSDNFSFGKVISGAGTVVQGGTGTLTLSGANTYTGNTLVNAGTLAFSSTGVLPTASPQVTVASGAVLDLSAITAGYTFGASSNQTLTVGRSGTAANDVLGNITSSSSTTTAGTLDIGGANTIRTATFGNNLTLNGATVKMDLSSNTSSNNDLLSVVGNLTLTGTNNLVVNPTSNSLGSGTYTLINYGGTLSGGTGNIALSGLPSGSTRQSFSLDAGTGSNSAITLAVSGSAANLTWVGNASNNVWDLVTTSNFTGAPGPTPDNRFYNLDAVTFDASGVGGSRAVTVSGTLSPASVSVTGSQDYTFSGSGSLNGSGPFTMSGTGTLTLAIANNSTGQTTLSSGTLTVATGGSISGPVVVNGGTLNANATSSLTGSLTVNGGTVVGAGTTSLPGTITINGGLVSIASNTRLPSTAAVLINGGTLEFTGGSSTNTNQVFTIGSNGGTISVDSGFVASMLGNQLLGPNNTLTKIGAGTLTLGSSGTSTVSTINVNEGIFRLTSGRIGGTSALNVASGATLYILDTTTFTTTSPFSMASGGSITLNGDGANVPGVTGSSLLGTTTGSGAYLHTLDEAGSATAGVNIPITLASTSRFTLTALGRNSGIDTVTDTFTQTISGVGGLIKDGEGTMILAAANTYGGSTIISNGTLQISSGADRLPTGTTLQLGESGSSNSGVFDMNGQNQTVAGLTSGGTGTANQIINSASGTPTFTVNYAGSSPQTFSGALGGGATGNSFAFAKSGSGTVVLTGSNSFSGGTTVSGGTLLANNTAGSATGTGNVAVNSDGTLGGNGTITPGTGNTVSVNNGGTITAGTGVGSSALAIGANGLTLNNSSTYQVKLFGTGPNDISLLNVTGDVTIGSGALLKLDLSGLSSSDVSNLRTAVGQGNTQTYTIITGTGSVGNFSASNFSISNVGSFNSSEWSLVTNPSAGTVQLAFSPVPVPEPATVLGIAAGALGLGGLVRRRFRKPADAIA